MDIQREVLDINKLNEIITVLSFFKFSNTRWLDLGVALNLSYIDLKNIETNQRGDVSRCMLECLSLWLKSLRNWQMLIPALRKIKEEGVAEGILKLVTDPASQLLQQYSTKLSETVLTEETVQLLHTEGVITEGTATEVKKCGHLLVDDAFLTLRMTVADDHNKLDQFAHILMKSGKTVFIANDIIKEYIETFITGAIDPFSPHAENLANRENSESTGTSTLITTDSITTSNATDTTNTDDNTVKEVPLERVEFDRMRNKLGHLLHQMALIIENSIPSVTNLKHFLRRCRPELKPQLKLAETFDNVMEIIEGKCFLLNISLLEAIADEYLLEEAKVLINEYEKKLNIFCDNSLRLCNNVPLKNFSTSPLVCETIRFTVNWEMDDDTLNDIRNLLSRAFSSLANRVEVVVIKEGNSITVTCYAPHYLMESLLVIAKGNLDTLKKKEGLISLTIGYYTVYDQRAIDEEIKMKMFSIERATASLKETEMTKEFRILKSHLSQVSWDPVAVATQLHARLVISEEALVTIKSSNDDQKVDLLMSTLHEALSVQPKHLLTLGHVFERYPLSNIPTARAIIKDYDTEYSKCITETNGELQIQIGIPQSTKPVFVSLIEKYKSTLFAVCESLSKSSSFDELMFHCYDQHFVSSYQLAECSDILSLLRVLCDNCSLTNISILEDISKAIKNDEALIHIMPYVDVVKGFNQEVWLHDCIEEIFSPVSHLECELITIHVAQGVQQWTLFDVEDLLVTAFNKNMSKIVKVISIEETPESFIVITCSFVLTQTSQLFEKASKNITLLLKKDVFHLTIGYSIVYDHKQMEDMDLTKDMKQLKSFFYYSTDGLEQMAASSREQLMFKKQKEFYRMSNDRQEQLVKTFEEDEQYQLEEYAYVIEKVKSIRQMYEEKERMVNEMTAKKLKEKEDENKRLFLALESKKNIIGNMSCELNDLKSENKRIKEAYDQREKEHADQILKEKDEHQKEIEVLHEESRLMKDDIAQMIKEKEDEHKKEFEALHEELSLKDKELQSKQEYIKEQSDEIQSLKSSLAEEHNTLHKEESLIQWKDKNDAFKLWVVTQSEYIGKENSLEIYKVKTSSRRIHDNIYKCEFGRPNLFKPTKVIMLMGATGAGKSTLINGMVNYILGVKFEDDFRFKLICDERQESQAHSQTNEITAYTFYWQIGFQVPYNLTIIDTPGFGDTRGLERDKKITEQIKHLFSLESADGIDQIHGIGIVTPSSSVRLTPTQRYIFSSIFGVFGKDITNNVFLMVTFADGVKPAVLQIFKDDDMHFSDFFLLNNCALYDDPCYKLNSLFWEMTFKTLHRFLSHIQQVSPASLRLSREVLQEREILENTMKHRKETLQERLAKMDILRKEERVLKEKDTTIKENKDFEYNLTVTKTKQVMLTSEEGSAVNCINCYATCHYPCNTLDDELYECAAMDMGRESAAMCQICPGNCSWKDHRKHQYRLEDYEEEETRTLTDFLQRYNEATADKHAIERAIKNLEVELFDLSEKASQQAEIVKNCLKRLNEIALRPNTAIEEINYLDLLIEAEKLESRSGCTERIKRYTEMKIDAQELAKTHDDHDGSKSRNKWWKFWL